jgi:hypothetical protein
MPSDGYDPVERSPAPARYHVTAVLLDVDRRRVVSYEFWSMEDPERGHIENIGRITHTPISGQRREAERAARCARQAAGG